MMLPNDSADYPANCLAQYGRLDRHHSAHWQLDHPDVAPKIDVRLTANWLLLRATYNSAELPPPAAPLAPWQAPLLASGHLPGQAKFVFVPGSLDWGVTAELTLHDDVDLADRIAESMAGFVQADRMMRQWQSEPGAAANRSAVEVDSTTAPAVVEPGRLLALAQECGWPFQARSSGPSFRLEAGDEFVVAGFECDAAGVCRLRAVLDGPGVDDETSWEACRRLLLLASGAVRLARACEWLGDGGSQLAWEVTWPSPPASIELRDALIALSLGVSLTCRELRLLGDEQLARQYLDVRGWSSPVSSPLPVREGETGLMTTQIATMPLAIQAADVSGQKVVRVAGLAPETSVGELVSGLIPKMGLPELDADGRRLAYHVRLEREGRHLHASEIVGDVLAPGDRIVLQPNIMAGGR